MKIRVLAAFATYVAVGLSSYAQPPPQTLHERVLSTYNFSPHTLDDAGLSAHSKDLDAFWTFAKDSGREGLRALRAELNRTDAPSFFNYDGAKLLLSLSKDRADEKLALIAIARADLRDVQMDDYLFTIHDFAVDELDTSEAAFKILADPTFKVFVPQHVLTLEQDYCLLYLLLPTKEEFYLDRAIAQLNQEKDVTAFRSLLHLLAATATRKADAAIKRYADDETRPEPLRILAKNVDESMKRLAALPVIGMSFSSYASLKQEQRTIMAR